MIALQAAQHWQGVATLTPPVIAPAFLAIAAISMLSMIWYWRLPRDIGRELSGARAEQAAAEGETAA